MAVQGRLIEMDLPTLVQWACQEGSRARLRIEQNEAEVRLYFDAGSIVHAHLHDAAHNMSMVGEEVVYHILDWEDGAFVLETGIDAPERTIFTPWTALLVEGLQQHDHRQDDVEAESDLAGERAFATEHDEIEQQTHEELRRDSMAERATSDILNDLLEVPGVSTAVVVGRDGFVIEAAGGTRTLNLDALGASLAHAINGIERMGQELQIRTFEDLFVEYGDAMIVARPVGDAVIALVAPDASQLGIIRYQIKPLVSELASFF